MTLCAPWLDAADVELCDNLDPKLPRALEFASWLLYWATAQQFPGLCTDSVRPCSQSAGVQMLDYPSGLGSRPLPVMGGCGCGGASVEGFCGCTAHSLVRLPGTLIADVLEVKVDGVTLTAGADYKIVRDQFLLRVGGWWPCCQNIALDDTEPGTWSIQYRYGLLPPPPLITAVELLACQLVASWCTGPDCGECRLPQRLTQLTYEGASMTTLDPFSFLENGLFGIYEVDEAVKQANPNRLQRNGVARTPADFLTLPTRVR